MGASMAGSQVTEIQTPINHERQVPNMGARYQPGTAAYYGNHDSDIDNRVPEKVAESLTGRDFRSFDDLRRALNVAWASDSGAASRFSDRDLGEMRHGRNPYASDAQTIGKRIKMEYDHYKEIRDGVDPYSIGNLRLVSPTGHIKKIGRIFNKMAGSA